MTAGVRPSFGVEILSSPDDLVMMAAEWNQLAERGGSPFLTTEWLISWWSAFGRGAFTCLLVRDADGSLRAGVCCRRLGGHVYAAANAHSGDWDAVAGDDGARAALWRAVASLGAGHVQLVGLRGPGSAATASGALGDARYSVVQRTGVQSPYLELPETWDELLASVSRNLRSQLGRRRRALSRHGELRFRTARGGDQLEPDLQAFLRLEGSGWKARSGTAITSDGRTERLYTDFARSAAHAGWLRLHMLELDGQPIAADLNCTFAGGTFLVKTGFDERYADLSPGLVLRGEVLRASIEDGAGFYDFLGGPDQYKLRWGAKLRPQMVVNAYRGTRRPLVVYESAIRPVLKATVTRLRAMQARAQ